MPTGGGSKVRDNLETHPTPHAPVFLRVTGGEAEMYLKAEAGLSRKNGQIHIRQKRKHE